jgi:hypothetical protein
LLNKQIGSKLGISEIESLFTASTPSQTLRS